MSTSLPLPDQKRSQREILIALSGLIMGMFVAILSGTVVSTSLPRIIADLGGDQASYTWVITASLLATAVSTPIWGKLSDLLDRKLLLQLSLGLFVLGTVIAGFSTSTAMLIALRVVQGIGAGGLTSLVFVAVALIISPRERGKYMGIVGGVMAVATIGGPLLGGIITDAFGWRANFFIGVPIAVAAIIIIQRTLHLPRANRKVRIDFVGAALLALGVSLLLIWVSMGGNQFEWNSMMSYALVGVSVLSLIGFVVTEFRVSEPIVPMALFKNRTFTLSVVASIAVGVAMFSTSVFLAQYFQLARGANPTQSGLMTIPLVLGQMLASIIIGQFISRFGKWKRWMVGGSVLVLVGVTLMSTLRYDTDFLWVSVYMVILGAGLGMVMQNLSLVVQNDTPAAQLGAATSNVAFFRSVAGAIGVTIMGSILASQVTSHIKSSLDGFVPSSADEVDALKALGTGNLPDVSSLPHAIRVIVESAYGNGIADAFIVAIPLAFLSLLAIIFLPNKSLSTKTAAETLAQQAEESVIDIAEAEIGATPTGSIAVVTVGGGRAGDGER
ncbi:MAG: transporter [Rhodoglobus sp.]|nr:transporter [Rhodoglobus sp.]